MATLVIEAWFSKDENYFFPFFLLKQWHNSKQCKHTQTHAKHKELEDKRENMAHICVVLCCLDINKQVVFANTEKGKQKQNKMKWKEWEW